MYPTRSRTTRPHYEGGCAQGHERIRNLGAGEDDVTLAYPTLCLVVGYAF
jgi:hypothetical protein